MKNLFPILTLLALFSLSGCAEMYSGISNYNALNGAQCRLKACTFAGYSEQDGKYLDNMVVRDKNFSEELMQKEVAWVKSKRMDYIYQSNFGTFYATSPYSNNSYKFYTYCRDYH